MVIIETKFRVFLSTITHLDEYVTIIENDEGEELYNGLVKDIPDNFQCGDFDILESAKCEEAKLGTKLIVMVYPDKGDNYGKINN